MLTAWAKGYCLIVQHAVHTHMQALKLPGFTCMQHACDHVWIMWQGMLTLMVLLVQATPIVLSTSEHPHFTPP